MYLLRPISAQNSSRKCSSSDNWGVQLFTCTYAELSIELTRHQRIEHARWQGPLWWEFLCTLISFSFGWELITFQGLFALWSSKSAHPNVHFCFEDISAGWEYFCRYWLPISSGACTSRTDQIMRQIAWKFCWIFGTSLVDLWGVARTQNAT